MQSGGCGIVREIPANAAASGFYILSYTWHIQAAAAGFPSGNLLPNVTLGKFRSSLFLFIVQSFLLINQYWHFAAQDHTFI